jgi:hypothetical protein
MAVVTFSSIKVAFCGNSILYYNDCPRMVEHLLKESSISSVTQNSCLRGGATLVSLLETGNGMAQKFATPPARLVKASSIIKSGEQEEYDIGALTVNGLLLEGTKWDFLVLNDHTQSPARLETRQATMRVLKDRYAPLLQANNKNGTIILLQTPAYRRQVKNSQDLGDFDEFTTKIQHGYLEYEQVLNFGGGDDNMSSGKITAKVAPVGMAYHYLYHHDRKLWSKLYAQDDFHPSPHGTWLEACVLYCTMVGQVVPPVYDNRWWKTARYMQPPDTEPLELPTAEEAHFLRQVAAHVCGLLDSVDMSVDESKAGNVDESKSGNGDSDGQTSQSPTSKIDLR